MPKKKTEPRKLSDKQVKFIEYYLLLGNATKAAIKAGYAKGTASSQGSQQINKAIVFAEIEKRRRANLRKLSLKSEDIVKELIKIGFSDPTDVMEWKDNVLVLKDSKDLPDFVKPAIKSIKQTMTKSGPVIELRFHDKLKALELLGRNFGIWHDKIEVEVVKPFVIEKLDGTTIEASREVINVTPTVEGKVDGSLEQGTESPPGSEPDQ